MRVGPAMDYTEKYANAISNCGGNYQEANLFEIFCPLINQYCANEVSSHVLYLVMLLWLHNNNTMLIKGMGTKHCLYTTVPSHHITGYMVSPSIQTYLYQTLAPSPHYTNYYTKSPNHFHNAW